MIKVRPDPGACDPDKLYEYIAHQIEREDNLYQTRLTTCVVINLGLSAAVASQVSGQINARIYVIVTACCVIGYLVTRGIRVATNAGMAQGKYLWAGFGDIEKKHPKRYPHPYYISTKKKRNKILEKVMAVLGKLTAITVVFEAIWIAVFIFVTYTFFNP